MMMMIFDLIKIGCVAIKYIYIFKGCRKEQDMLNPNQLMLTMLQLKYFQKGLILVQELAGTSRYINCND